MKINIFKELKKVYAVARKEFNIKLFCSIILRALLLIIPVLFSKAVNAATIQNYKTAIIYVAISIGITIVYRLSECINQKTFYDLYNKLYHF